MSAWGWMTGTDDATRALKSGYQNAQGMMDTSLASANAAWNPYSSAGSQGIASLASLIQGGGNVSGRLDSAGYLAGNDDPGVFTGVGDLTQDAGYQNAMKTARASLNENQFLDGTYGSGAAAKEMADYMQGTAQNYTNDAYNRALSTYEARANQANTANQFDYQRYLSDLDTLTADVNRQQSLATTMLGAGQNAASAQAGNYMNWGQTSAGNATGMANAQAQNAMASSPWSMFSSLANMGAQGAMAASGMGAF